jgi:hypothetical protein
MIAFILIALGAVFFLGQAKALDYSSSWWVIFIAIPGIALLWAAFTTHQQAGGFTTLTVIQAILGVAAILLSVIFLVDPQWSFTRSWRIDNVFPFLRDIYWDRIWPWFLILPGAWLLYVAFRQRQLGTGIIGAALVVVGAVFVLSISWDVVWPLAIVALGVGLLLYRRPVQS